MATNTFQIYDLPVMNIVSSDDKEFYEVEYEGQVIRVLKFPGQAYDKKTLSCIYVGESPKTGRPMFNQDMNSVLYEFYEDDCNYYFKVEHVCVDPNTSATYLMLTDDYGLRHRLYVNESSEKEGNLISCYVRSIEKGHLNLEKSLDTSFSGSATFGIAEVLDLAAIDFSELKPEEDSSLRDYQIDNKRKIYQAWCGARSVMLQMPTGTGKTRLFVSIVKDLHNWGAAHKKAVKVLILAHRKELIEQISNNVGLRYGLAHGLITANNQENKLYPVQVGSVPTLNRRLDRWEDKNFDVIIIDEAHHVKAESYRKILDIYPSAKILGVTATPCRLNGAGFRPEFDELIVSPSVSDFIKRGYLCEYDYYSIRMESELQKEIDDMSLAFDGDYLEDDMINVMDRDSIRANIISTYLKYAKGKKGIVYTINRSHNEHICNKFNEVGVKAVAIDSLTPKEERDTFVRDFKSGKIQVLCNVNIFSEGFDCPDVEFIQLARPTKSLSLYLQQVGRGLRPAPNKDKLLILDNVGLYNKFGFPSSRRHWRYHFEGKKDVEDSVAESRNLLDENRQIFDIEEGNSQVDLLHSSQTEKGSGEISESESYSFKDEFLSYLTKSKLSFKTSREYIRTIDTYINQKIKDHSELSLNSLFDTCDFKVVDNVCMTLKSDSDFVAYNKQKHYFPLSSLNKYAQFTQGRKCEINEPDATQKLNDLRTIIELCERNSMEVPENVKNEYERLSGIKDKDTMISDIKNKLLEMDLLAGISLEYDKGSASLSVSYKNPNSKLQEQLLEIRQVIKLMNKNQFPVQNELLTKENELDISVNRIKDVDMFQHWLKSYLSKNSDIQFSQLSVKDSFVSFVDPVKDISPVHEEPSLFGDTPFHGLRVTLENGQIIQERKSKDTYLQTLDYIGYSNLKELDIIVLGEPLLHPSKITKYERYDIEVLPGFYVNTYTSNERKASLINKISQSLNLKIKAEIV